MSVVETTAIIGAVTGVSGLLVGILNWWHQRVSTRPHIKVRPHVLGSGKRGIVVISNVGHVPVFGDHIGWLGKHRDDKGHVLLPDEQSIDDKWTSNHVLMPQDGDCASFKLDDLPKEQEVGVIYAQTIVGDRWKAGRRDMWRFRRQLAQLRR